jgi:hypothetical protein
MSDRLSALCHECNRMALDTEFEIIRLSDELFSADQSLNLKQLSLLEQGTDGPISGKNAEVRALQLEFHCEEEAGVVRKVQANIARARANLKSHERQFAIALALLQKSDSASAD